MAILNQTRERLASVQEELKKLSEEERVLISTLKKETHSVDELTKRYDEARQQARRAFGTRIRDTKVPRSGRD